MTLKTTILVLGIAITLTTVSGLKCYVSRGYQSLEDLNKNKADPDHSRQCNSTYPMTFSSCFSYTGFGDGETYPFESDHGTQLNGTIVEDINSQCQDAKFACSSIPIENNTNSRRLLFSSGNCTIRSQVQCPSGKCIRKSYLCDGDNDCGDRSDEQGCSRYNSYRYRPKKCVSNYGICNGQDDCADGSDERQDFCAARYSNEEFGRHGCLGDGQDLGAFFGRLVGGHRRHPGSSLLDELISKTKAKVDVSMPGVKLVGTGSTNFKTLMDKTLLNDLQEVNIDLVAKVDELSIKLRMTGDFTSAYKAFVKLTSGCLGGRTHQCPSGRCIPTRYLCDGNNNCGDRSDEQNCSGSRGKREVDDAEAETAFAEAEGFGSYNDYPYPNAEANPEGAYNDYPYPEAEDELESSHSSYLSEILDVFDGPFGIIEQSIVGNVKDTYKKVKHLINWVETNMENRGPYDRDNEWSSHGNESIDFGVKLHVTVGTENVASIRLTGEAHDFVKGYIGMKMEGNLEFCDDDGKCSRFGVCRTDLCNTFKPLESNDIPAL